MVFCCFSCTDPEINAAPERKVSVEYSSPDWVENAPLTYYRTSVNELSATPPPQPIIQPATSVAVMPPAAAAPTPEQQRQSSPQQPKLIAVKVPTGAYPGQTLKVEYDNGRFMEAQVPMGMTVGSTFYVRPDNDNNNNTDNDHAFAQALDDLDPLPATQTRAQQHPFNNNTGTTSRRVPPPPPSSDSIPFSECLDDMSDGYARASYTSTLNKKVVKVTVPPNTRSGSTIHVKIPGEGNRIIAAIVPPNCTEFNVTYDPKHEHEHEHDHAFRERRNHSPLKHFTNSHPEQKVLLVRVPHGIAAGETIHVQIPGEPGRAVKAVVPPGNVQQFHVSYTPQR